MKIKEQQRKTKNNKEHKEQTPKIVFDSGPNFPEILGSKNSSIILYFFFVKRCFLCSIGGSHVLYKLLYYLFFRFVFKFVLLGKNKEKKTRKTKNINKNKQKIYILFKEKQLTSTKNKKTQNNNIIQ